MNGDTWTAVKSTIGTAAQGDQVALDHLAGVLTSALVPVKGVDLVKGEDTVVTIALKEGNNNFLIFGEELAGSEISNRIDRPIIGTLID